MDRSHPGRLDGAPPTAAAPDPLAVLSSDWYWEQDADFRYTRILLPEHAQGTVEPSLALGKCRWELPEARVLRGSWDAHRATVQRRERFHDLQYSFVPSTGGPARYLSCSGEPRLDAGGRFVGYRGTTRDITTEWHERRKLADTERLLRIATRMARFGGWVVDLSTGHSAWSDEVCAIHELPAGRKPTLEEALDFYVPEHRPLMADALRRCTHQGVPFDLELQILTARGRRVWVRAMGEAVRDAEGAIVQVQGAFQDIDALRALADERQKLANELTATLEGLADGFAVVDAQWRFTYINAEACRILRRARTELLGRSAWAAFPEVAGTRFATEYRRAMRDGVAVQFREFFAPVQSWLRVRAWPTPDGGLAVSFVDVTPQVEAETQLRELNARLEDRVRERTVQLENATREVEMLTYAVAHDLRAPLASIDAFSHVLADTEAQALSPRGQGYLQRIRAAAQWMGEMTTGILQLGRLASEPAAPADVDLSALALRVWETVSAQDPQRCVAFEAQADLQARGNAAQLALVLQNLLGNAWKFTGRTPQARVEFGRVQAGADEQVFFVRDNGAGFDPEYAGKLFTPFHSLHDRKEFPGSGIGLATVQKIVRLHGGRVWAEGQPEGGARFLFALPVAAA